MLIWSTTWDPLRIRTGLLPILMPGISLAGSLYLPKEPSDPELIILMIVAQSLFTLREINQMERELCLYALSHPKGLIIKSFRNKDCERQPNKVVSSANSLSARLRSLKNKAKVLPSILKPASVWADLPRHLSIGLRRQAHLQLSLEACRGAHLTSEWVLCLSMSQSQLDSP